MTETTDITETTAPDDALVQRLRASVAGRAVAMTADGYRDGEHWAREYAPAWELEKVAIMSADDFSGYVDEVAYAIRRRYGTDSQLPLDVDDDTIPDSRFADSDYAGAFATAARTVWHSVADRL
jgi:hypothetical protein